MRSLIRLVLTPFLGCSLAHGPVLMAEETGNLAVNPGFEEDFVNLNGESHVISFKGDWFYNQKDNVPDYWALQGEWKWDAGAARSGVYGLTLGANGQATRSYPMAVWQSGGGSWGGANNNPMKSQNPDRFPRALRASVWCRGGGKIRVSIDGVSAEAACPGAGQGWQQVEAVLPAEKQKAAAAANLQLFLIGPGSFDDVRLAEDLSGSPNLAPDTSFESLDGQGYPAGWSRQRKYSWFGPTYYIWTDWNHFQGENRGDAVSDPLVAFSGQRSFRFDVYPGDEKYVESPPIALNQDLPRPVEIGVMVKADRIKLLDLRAANEDGDDLPTYRPMSAGGGTEIYGSGTFEWRYIRKFVSPLFDRPIKTVRVRLCARGFDAHTLDDGGTRPYALQAGTVWWDDWRVMERESRGEDLAARGVSTPPATPRPDPGYRVEELDLGERLYGENVLRLVLRNTSAEAAPFQGRLGVAASQGGASAIKTAQADIRPGETGTLILPYRIDRLEDNFYRQGHLALAVQKGTAEPVKVAYAFNTWPVILDFDFSKHYSYPNENPLAVAVNLGVAKATLQKVDRLEIVARRVSDGAALIRHEVAPLLEAFEKTRAQLPTQVKESYEHTYPTPFWWADKTNLLALRLDISALKVWPQDQPTRDTFLEATATDAAGQVLFRDRSQAFGRMEKLDRNSIPEIRSVQVREDGAVLINGQPKLLTGATHQHTRFHHTFEAIADLGFLGHRLVGDVPLERLDEIWAQHRLYALAAKPVAKMGTTPAVAQFSDEQRAAFKDWVGKGGGRNVVSFNTGGWEAQMDVSNPEQAAQHQKLNDEIRQVSGRLVSWSPSGAYNAWWLGKTPFYDLVCGETEMWGPMDYNVVWAPHQRKVGRWPAAWLYLPQLYDNHPFERLRFETYENLLRGSAGYAMIQGIGDPTFLRGLNGELRYLESRWYSQEKPPVVQADPPISFQVRRLADKAYVVATNSGPVPIGVWKWHAIAQSGRLSHEGDSINRMWRCPGWTLHGWRVDRARPLQAGDRIIQYVRIDPEAPPECVILGIRGDGQFIHNVALGSFSFPRFQADAANLLWFTELNHSTWHAVWCHFTPERYQKAVRLMGQAWADQHMKYSDEHKKYVDEHTYRAEHFKSLGPLPRPGDWHRIEIAAEDLGLAGKWVDGFCFSTCGGKALWDTTAISRGGVEDVLCDDSVGIDRARLARVTFAVSGMPEGAAVRALFEDRSIPSAGGQFRDDFQGTDTYGLEGIGVTGDNFGYVRDEMRELVNLLPSGYGYTYGPTAVHLYEIPLK
ncbi:MAG: hypothetical protein HYU36_14235 [Planctomycetes bacterium]|nr:hypothetical protein [Planctomycetota bacterium]